MMRMRLLAIGVAVAAVAAAGCDGFFGCDEIDHVISAQTSEPGEVRNGIELGAGFDAVAPRADGGVVCVACGGLSRRDADLREDGRIGALDRPRTVAVAPDGTAYTTHLPSRTDGSPGVHEVIAFEPGGSERWRVSLTVLGSFPVPQRLMADDARVYVALSSSLVALDSATGAVVWQRPDDLLGVAREGVFVADGTTVRHLSGDGAVIWERPMTSQSAVFTIHDAAVTPDGGAIVVGRAENTIDFGDRILEGMPGRTLNFAVEIDPTGATRWAFKADVMLLEHVALAETGELLLAGVHSSLPREDSLMDSFLALATRDGIVRTHRIGGPADQLVEDLIAAPGGGAWVQISNLGFEDEPDPELRVGAARLGERGTYLLEIVP